MKKFTDLVQASTLGLGLFFSTVAHAIGPSLPGPNWGNEAYPQLSPARDYGMEVYLFSEFGQDKSGNCLETQTCNRYNDVDRTIGINVLRISSSRYFTTESQYKNNIIYSNSLLFGWSGDKLTNYFQNDFIHQGSIRKWGGGTQLPEVPRGKVAPCELLLGWIGEMNYNPLTFLIQNTSPGRTEFEPSKYFLGGGLALSNIYSDSYLHLGVKEFQWKTDNSNFDEYVFVSTAALFRAGMLFDHAIPVESGGLLAGQFHSDEISQSYSLVQGSLRLNLLDHIFPMVFSYTLTASTGVFQASESGSGPSRSLLPERYSSIGIDIGDWKFETSNDSPGGKDKGPTFAARVSIVANPSNTYSWALHAIKYLAEPYLFIQAILGRGFKEWDAL